MLDAIVISHLKAVTDTLVGEVYRHYQLLTHPGLNDNGEHQKPRLNAQSKMGPKRQDSVSLAAACFNN